MKNLKALVALLFLLLGYDVASACSCAPSGSPTEELNAARAVFTGEVVEARVPVYRPVRKRGRVVTYHVDLMSKVKFRVTRWWKGVDGGTVTVEPMTSTSACGYPFVKGESYLVYTYGDGKRLLAGVCSRTKKLADARSDLAELGEGMMPVRRLTAK